MTTQIFMASTLYGTATLAAALDSDCFRPADRRILLVSNNAATPTTPGLDDAGFEQLRGRFDDVISWNRPSPFHPGGWRLGSTTSPCGSGTCGSPGTSATTTSSWPSSIQVNPALGISQIFMGAPVTVYADGLMSYGPAQQDRPAGRHARDPPAPSGPGPRLKPLLLTEFGVEPEIVPTDAFSKVLAELVDTGDELPFVDEPALLLGQYLSALDILTAEEEENLHVRMLKGALALGHTRVVFKPHPSAPARWSRLLEKEAEKLGADLTVLDTPVLAEVSARRYTGLVVGCFSTALLTASALYGLPVAGVGTGPLLDRLTPYGTATTSSRSSGTRCCRTDGRVGGQRAAPEHGRDGPDGPRPGRRLRDAAEDLPGPAPGRRDLPDQASEPPHPALLQAQAPSPRWRCPARSRRSWRSSRATPPCAAWRAARAR